ncbi:hypothetical protein FOCC_FOCC017445 [Frankliniella occidentalis]|nr:hypothetical protein FOCC_FOCC017445 [Frankliniella occidentalis]
MSTVSAASHGSGTSQSHADMRTLLGLLPSALAQHQPSSSSFIILLMLITDAAQQLGGSTPGISQGSSTPLSATPGTPTNGIPGTPTNGMMGFSSLLNFLPTGHVAPGFNAGQPVTPGASNANLSSLLSLLSPGQPSAPSAVPSTSHGAFGSQQPATVPCPNDPAGLLASLMAMAAPQQPAVAAPTNSNAFMNLLSSSVQPADVSSILEGFANQQQQQQVQQSRDNGLSALMSMLGGGGSGVAMAGAMNAGGRLLPFEFKNSRGRPPKQRKTILKRLGSNLASMMQAAAVQTAGVSSLVPAPAMAQAPAQQEPATPPASSLGLRSCQMSNLAMDVYMERL